MSEQQTPKPGDLLSGFHFTRRTPVTGRFERVFGSHGKAYLVTPNNGGWPVVITAEDCRVIQS